MAMVTVMLIIMACLINDECPQEHLMGGDCLNVGCAPSKALIRAARAVHEVRHAAEFGISVRDVRVDFGTVGQLGIVPQLHCEASNACDLLRNSMGPFPLPPSVYAALQQRGPFAPPLGSRSCNHLCTGPPSRGPRSSSAKCHHADQGLASIAAPAG